MKKMTEAHRKLVSIIAVVLAVLLVALITALLWRPLLGLVEDPMELRRWVEEKGLWGGVVFVLLSVVQILLALIPGEPMEIAAGLAFGWWQGALLCLAAIALGSALAFLLVRHLGVKMVEVFFPVEKIRNLRFLQDHRRFRATLFLIMVLPGTPKDLISYFIGLTDMRLGTWVLLTTLARIPSVVTSTLGGSLFSEGNTLASVLVFGATALVSLGGMLLYEGILRRKNQEEKEER